VDPEGSRQGQALCQHAVSHVGVPLWEVLM
jgi:hypothetical protein